LSDTGSNSIKEGLSGLDFEWNVILAIVSATFVPHGCSQSFNNQQTLFKSERSDWYCLLDFVELRKVSQQDPDVKFGLWLATTTIAMEIFSTTTAKNNRNKN
jgi:hypothetical protein